MKRLGIGLLVVLAVAALAGGVIKRNLLQARFSHDPQVLGRLMTSHEDESVRAVAKKSLVQLAAGQAASYKRCAAIEVLDDPAVLQKLALNDLEPRVRLAAVKKVNDPAVLSQVIAKDRFEEAVVAAVERLDDPGLLLQLALQHVKGKEVVRRAAIARLKAQRLTDDRVWFKVAKQAADTAVRRAAIAELTGQATLSSLATTGRYEDIRQAAVERLTDQDQLSRIVMTDASMDVRLAAVEGITDQAILTQLFAKVQHLDIRSAIVAKLTDQTLLARLAREGDYWHVRENAIRRLIDPAVLTEVALNPKCGRERQYAVDRITDPAVLTKLANEDEEEAVRLAAATWLKVNAVAGDQAALAKLALEDDQTGVRKAAARKLTDAAAMKQVWTDSKDGDVRRVILEGACDQDLLIYAVEHDESSSNRQAAARKIGDQTVLARIALDKKAGSAARLVAVEKLDDQSALETVACEDDNKDVRYAAASRLTDLPTLLQVALCDEDRFVRVRALLKLDNPELLAALIQREADPLVRQMAILMTTDQAKLKELAVSPNAATREPAVVGIDDETFLLDRLQVDASPTVRAAIVDGLHTEQSLYHAAKTSYYRGARAAAMKRLAGTSLEAEARAAQAEIARQVEALSAETPSEQLVSLALDGRVDDLRLAAAKQISAQEDLMAVAMAATDREVLKVVLPKLTDADKMATVADKGADVAIRLASAQRSGRQSWKEIFDAATAKGQDTEALGDALAAISLFGQVQDDAKAAVEQTCLMLIRRGDESRIPEMIDLLNLYGNVTLCEDYLNCGQPDLDVAGRRWAHARGYNISSGYGSSRAQWGSSR